MYEMIDTVLFDLDGTLLHFTQDEFVAAYFTELRKVFARLGLDAELAVKALWDGTKAMIRSDGAKLNSERFWEVFAAMMDLSGERLQAVEAACDRFYSNEFNAVKAVLKNTGSGLPCRLVRGLTERGFCVALATNPLFPACAVATRLGWAGLAPDDFSLITDYSNSRYCKPNPDYYREILKKLGREPQSCLMIGNNTSEDMAAGTLGIETFLVTDFTENEAKIDVSVFRRGTLAELEAFLASLPDPGERADSE